MIPDEVIGIGAVHGVLARCIATPRIGVDAGATVICLQEEVANVRRNPDQVIAISIINCTKGLEINKILHGLKDQFGTWRYPFSLARQTAFAQG